MPRPCLEHLAALLEGYSDPIAKKWAVNGNAIGENGLTIRTRSVIVLDSILQKMIDPKHWEKYADRFVETYPFIVSTVRSTWTGEFLRLMDKPETNVKGRPRENLTVKLFHKRFQAERLVPLKTRNREDELFNGLIAFCETCAVELFRNRCFAHIDLVDHQAAPMPHGSGSIHELTRLLKAWYAFAAEAVMGVEPRFVTQSGEVGTSFFSELREMMVGARRRSRRNQFRRLGPNPDATAG
jgi:hypothetical protein